MNNDMNDHELNQLLKQWEAPGAPPSLERKVLPRRSPLAFLWRGSIRIPVPVAIAASLAVAAWLYFSHAPEPASPPPRVTSSDSVSLAEFEPVKELKVRVLPVGGQPQ